MTENANYLASVRLSVDNGERYDEIIASSLPEGGDLELAVKPAAMRGSRRSAVVVTFTVGLPDGSTARVQAATSLRVLRQAVAALPMTEADRT